MMRVGGVLRRSLPATIGTPQSVDSALSGAGKQQEQGDHPSHELIMLPNGRISCDPYSTQDGLEGRGS